MSYRTKAIAAAALSLATLAPAGFASAADLPVKAKAKPVADLPFFFVIDDRVTYSWMPKVPIPAFSPSSRTARSTATTAKQVYSFTHFDVWAYGTNFFTISMFKSDHNDPAAPCTNAGVTSTAISACGDPQSAPAQPKSTACSARTFGWNEIFNTKAFTHGAAA